MANLSQRELEELVVGKSQNPNAIFFEHASLDVERSKTEKRRIYNTLVYLKLSHPGVTDSVSYQAQKEDLIKYKDEYEYFLNNKQGSQKPGVEIIPNLELAHLQELRDYGILNIVQLAEMEVIPHHLEYAHRAAKIFNKALQETSNGKIEEDRIEEVQTEDVSADDRQQYQQDVRRPTVQASNDGEGQVRETAEGRSSGRRSHGRGNIVGNPIDNWSVGINFK